MSRSAFFTALAAALLLAGPRPAQSQSNPWNVRAGTAFPLAANASQLQNEYFRVEQWGVLSTRTTHWTEAWYYPTAADRNEAAVFRIDAHKFGVGDFDGDGARDVFLNMVAFPHTVSRPPIAPALLRNVGGQLRYWPEGWSGAAPERLMSYKVKVGDFNRDGRDDVVTGSAGIITRNANGTLSNQWEPIATAMSTPDGRLADGSPRVQGQEAGGVAPGFEFAHDLAVGDVNGDGNLDMFQGRNLFLGDGRGGFTNGNGLLPEAARSPLQPPAMSSAIADLDGDGLGDLVVAFMDGNGPLSGWIFLSDGRGIAQGRQVALPAGRYGAGSTKHNSLAVADLDRDGRPDIVIGQTRASPYYQGRTLQVLMNRGGGTFVDESDRITGDDRDAMHGEGPVTLMDINADGFVDIVDSAEGPGGLGVFVNDGRGRFTRMPRATLPLVRNRNLAAYSGLPPGHSFGDSEDANGKIYPIVLDGNGVSYLVQFVHSPSRFPQLQGDAQETTFYVVRALKPYGRASATSGLAAEDNVTGLWWNAAESGWGINFNHQGTTIFATLFSYAADGAGMWLVMSGGQRQADGSYQGDLYQTTGPAFDANPFPPLGGGIGSLVRVGSMRLVFQDRAHATVEYSVNNATVSKQVTPQLFGPPATCSHVAASAGSRAARTNYTDLWWVAAESGWGLNLAQQGDTVFATLFTYAAGAGTANRGMWLVMSGGQRQADGSYRGDLYRVTGPPFNANPFPPIGPANLTRVGSMQLQFDDGERGTLTYDVNGTTVVKRMTPQTFGSALPSCR